MMKVEFELTDTFGGEPNYSWIRRETFDYTDNPSDLAIVRRAKKWAGLTGEKCEVEGTSNDLFFAIRPRKMCQILFVIMRD
jgi:hypothetical protein